MPNVAKSLLFSLALSAVLSGCASPTVKQITILHTNDIHGRHLPIRVEPGNATAQTGDPGRSEQSFSRSGLIGGFAYLAGAVAKVRRDKGADNVLLVDGGDTFGDDLLGNLTKGEAMIGRQMMETLEQTATHHKTSDTMKGVGGLIQTSGLAYTVDVNRPEGQRVSGLMIGDRPIEFGRSYTIVTNAGMRGGIHNYSAFASGRNIVEYPKSVTQIIEDGFRGRRTIRFPELGQVKLTPAAG